MLLDSRDSRVKEDLRGLLVHLENKDSLVS